MNGAGQLSLLEPPPFAPRWPNPNSMASTALRMMLDGQEVDHDGFMLKVHSHRLAAYVFDLRTLGWPVETMQIPAPTNECPGRTIARYRLPVWVRAISRQKVAA